MSNHTSNIDSKRKIEEAHELSIALCPDCGAPVILFCDDGGEIFAMASLSPDVAQGLVRFLQERLAADEQYAHRVH